MVSTVNFDLLILESYSVFIDLKLKVQILMYLFYFFEYKIHKINRTFLSKNDLQKIHKNPLICLHPEFRLIPTTDKSLSTVYANGDKTVRRISALFGIVFCAKLDYIMLVADKQRSAQKAPPYLFCLLAIKFGGGIRIFEVERLFDKLIWCTWLAN